MIATDRLRLRPLRVGDIDALIALDSDPEVMRHITGGRPTPRAAYVEVLLPRMLAAQTGGCPGFLAAEQDGAFVGWFHLRADSIEPAWREVGYRLARAVWGRGLATEGSRALVGFARQTWPGTPISGRTLPENLASRRVLEKCGLSFAGTFEFPARALPGLESPALPGLLYLAGP